MPTLPRATVLLASLTILWAGTSGYTSGCGTDNGIPNPRPVDVDPALVEWTVAAGDTDALTSTVAITQGDELAAAVEHAAPPPTEWLTATITTVGNSLALLLTASPEGLPAGEYEASVVVTAAELEPGRVTVRLTVTP